MAFPYDRQGFSTLPLLTCRAHGSWLRRRSCTKQEPRQRPRLHPFRDQQHPSPADIAKCVLCDKIVPGRVPMTQSICMKTQSLFCMRCDPRWVGQAQVTTVKETQTKCHYVYRRTSPVSRIRPFIPYCLREFCPGHRKGNSVPLRAA